MSLSNTMVLVKNELKKIMFQRSFLLLVICLFIPILILGRWDYVKIHNENSTASNWKENLIIENQKLKKSIDSGELSNSNLEEQHKINEYRINNNLSPETDFSLLGFMKKCAGMTSIIAIILIYFASSLMSKEYQWKTINFLLTRTSTRLSIFISKFLSMVMLYFVLIIIVMFYSMLVGSVLYGLNFHSYSDLSVVNGEVVEKSLIGSIFIQYIINLLPDLFFVALSYALSTILKSSGLSLLVGLALFAMSDPISMFIQNKQWGKYLPFMHTDLSMYLDSVSIGNGMTIQFSITILIIYIGLLLLLSGYVFKKRDIV